MRQLIAVVLAVVAVGAVGVAMDVVHFGKSPPPAALPADEAVPSAAGLPPEDPSLANGRLRIESPQGEEVLTTALSNQLVKGTLEGGFVPDSYPGFWHYTHEGRALSVLPGQQGTLVVVGHSGEAGTNEAFTPLTSLPDNPRPGEGYYRAILTTDAMHQEYLIQDVLYEPYWDLAKHQKLWDNRDGRVLFVFCEVVGGQLTGKTGIAIGVRPH